LLKHLPPTYSVYAIVVDLLLLGEKTERDRDRDREGRWETVERVRQIEVG
jgi:hypothetical protein